MSSRQSEHCGPCAFSELPDAATTEAIIRENLVKAHLVELVNEGATVETPFMPRDLSARERLAARQCAATIFSGECRLYNYSPSLEKDAVMLTRKRSW